MSGFIVVFKINIPEFIQIVGIGKREILDIVKVLFGFPLTIIHLDVREIQAPVILIFDIGF